MLSDGNAQLLVMLCKAEPASPRTGGVYFCLPRDAPLDGVRDVLLLQAPNMFRQFRGVHVLFMSEACEVVRIVFLQCSFGQCNVVLGTSDALGLG